MRNDEGVTKVCVRVCVCTTCTQNTLMTQLSIGQPRARVCPLNTQQRTKQTQNLPIQIPKNLNAFAVRCGVAGRGGTGRRQWASLRNARTSCAFAYSKTISRLSPAPPPNRPLYLFNTAPRCGLLLCSICAYAAGSYMVDRKRHKIQQPLCAPHKPQPNVTKNFHVLQM